MKRTLLAATVFLAAGGGAHAAAPSDNGRLIAACINAAADVHRVPPAVLVILLNVEGGELGHVSGNTNNTVDIGPMQVNQIWIPQVAVHWHATRSDTFLALRDSFCANVEAGAWILRQGLDEARGDFWQGVGYYHSHDPHHRSVYLQSVLKQVLKLQALVQQHAGAHASADVETAAAIPRTTLAGGR